MPEADHGNCFSQRSPAFLVRRAQWWEQQMTMPPGLSALPRGRCQFPFAPQINFRGKVGHAGLRLALPSSVGAVTSWFLLLELWGEQQQPCFWLQMTGGGSMYKLILCQYLHGQRIKMLTFSSSFILQVVREQCFMILLYQRSIWTYWLQMQACVGMGLLGGNINIFHTWVAVKKFESQWPRVHKSKVPSKFKTHLCKI